MDPLERTKNIGAFRTGHYLLFKHRRQQRVALTDATTISVFWAE